MSLDKLYTAEEVAAAFQLESPDWLEKNARADQIPHTKLGRRLRFTRAQIDQIVENCAVEIEPVVRLPQAQYRQAAPATRSAETSTTPVRLPAHIRAQLP